MIFFAVVVYLALFFALSIKETEVEITEFELNRRINSGQKAAEKLLIKKRIVPIFNRFRAFASVFLAILLAVSVADFLKFTDTLLVLAGLILVGFTISRTDFARRTSKKIFAKISPKLYAIFLSLKPKTQKKIFKMGEKKGWMFYSKEEMFDFLGKHKQILAEKELNWFEKISFLAEKSVIEVASLRENLDILNEKDLLTPLVIDELFKTKQSVFVVMDESEAEVKGVVKMSKISELSGDSKRVRTVMEREFLEISSEKNALDTFEKLIKSEQNFAILKNKKGEFVGLVNLRDFIKK